MNVLAGRWVLGIGLLCGLLALSQADETGRAPYFGIQVVDADSGRGIPLAELRTVNDIVLVSDSAGWVAFHEPGLMEREAFFSVSSPGYEFPKDGFGSRGVRLKPQAGKTATIKLPRTTIAERWFRLTGNGIYRDSVLLGLRQPVAAEAAGVLGQDSVQAVPFGDRIFWLWGDTNLSNYPLGNFQTTAATTPLAGAAEFSTAGAIPFSYFMSPQEPHRVRAMVPSTEPGPIWLFGLLNVRNPAGKETLVAHYTRQKNLAEVAEHGLVQLDETAGVFKKLTTLAAKQTWQFPQGNAVLVDEEGGPYFYFVESFATTRVKADWESLLHPERYEALTFDLPSHSYRWQHELPPTSQVDEQKRLSAGQLDPHLARYAVVDADQGRHIELHRSSIAWNAHRKRWILIGTQQTPDGKPSLLGEIWYAEAESIAGPWRKAIKIASHPHYTFYNPRQHVFLDRDDGRTIFFEGTYTNTFSGNPTPTPRYEYNQLLYRLDLTDRRLQKAQ